MKKLRSQFSWRLLLASVSTLFSVWSLKDMSASGYYPKAPETLNVSDTVRVACDTASTAYATWINTATLQVQFAYPGATVSITPTPPLNYVFPGACADTLEFTFLVSGGPDTSLTFVFIVSDTVAPRIQSSVPDSLSLSCLDAIPDSTSVTVTDNCSLDTIIYNETIEGSGNCPFAFKIVRTWLAIDGCGNSSSYRQVIVVSDDDAPIFRNFPPNLTIDCTVEPIPANTGRPDAEDECDPNPKVSFFDQEFPTLPGCQNDYSIQRTWVAEDTCGNVTFRQQIIRIRDMQAPTFTAPRDTTVSCTQGDDPLVTGSPANVRDNCDTLGPQNIRYQDVLINSSCPSAYTVRRTWYVSDNCGNIDSVLQIIQVVDDQAPVFTRQAVDLIIQCAESLNPDSLFWAWADRYGDALATDNCSSQIRWIALNAGTQDTISFPGISCQNSSQAIIERQVDFIAEDECGQRSVSTAVFRVVDVVAPQLSGCPSDTIIVTNPGACTASFRLPAPQVQDECFSTASAFSQTLARTLSSSNPGGDPGETPVAPVEFSFMLPGGFADAAAPATLRIRLQSVDGEGDEEYFRILGEDKTLIGITARTDVQCGNSETSFTLTQAQINAWGADGVIVLYAMPNIPDGIAGRFAVNPICPGASVEATLEVLLKDLQGLRLSYRVGERPLVEISDLQNTVVQLPLGRSDIAYYLTDCGGNQDSCFFSVTVQDLEPPVLICPADTLIVLSGGTCTAEVTLPLPVSATDNCVVLGAYERTLPADTASAYFTFDFNPNLNAFIANRKTFSFDGLGSNATDSATLRLDFLGDFASPNATFALRAEDGTLIAASAIGAATCTQPGSLALKFSPAQINAWASDGRVEFSLEPLNPSTPSGQPDEGTNPCAGAAVTQNGQTDSVSYVFATLSFPTINPLYYATGATPISLTTMQLPQVRPTHVFNVGVTEVFYIIEDASGNRDTCSFTITVEDRENPVARCQPTTLFINPSGLDNPVVSALEIDAGSTDNCGINSRTLTPNTFNCLQAGFVQNVTLTVTDFSGNSASCSTIVRIENLEPEPTASSGLCGSDTLFLRANPPAAQGGIIYTYRWTGPNGFASNRENPVIPNVSSRNAGSYVVEITGLTGCKATGVVEVSIEDLPLTPELLTRASLCEEDNIVLNSSIAPSGASVIYRWYRGLPPSGTLIGTTIVPSLTLPGPHPEGANTYYLTVEANGCLSRPSSPKEVQINKKPVAIPRLNAITICEGESIMLGTEVAGPGITYAWTGPSGYQSSSQFPAAISNATVSNSGIYSLTVFRNGCPSNPAFVTVTVLAKPARPELSNTGPVCAGETLTLRTNAAASVYTWVSPDLQEFSTTVNSFTIPNASTSIRGGWRLYITAQGCRSDLSLPSSVVVNELPRPVVATSPAVICENGRLELNASPNIQNATYRWTGPGGFVAVGANALIENVRTQNAGRYTVEVVTQDGCTGSAFTDVDVKRGVRIIAVTNDGPDCLSGPTDIRLTASLFPADDGTYAYRWTGPNGFLSTNRVGLIPNATQLNNGNYQLLVTTSEGCASNPGSTVVSVADAPPTPETPRISDAVPGPLCEGQSLTLCTNGVAGGTVTYHWVTPNNGIVVTTSPCLSIRDADMNDRGSYAVFVTVNGCRSRNSGNLSLNINPKPVISASNNGPVCAGAQLELRASVIPGAEYRWTGPNLTSSLATLIIPQADSAIHAGLYSVVALVNGCESEIATTDARILPAPPIPVLEAVEPLCISTPNTVLSLKLNPGSTVPGSVYTWTGPSGLLGTTISTEFSLANFSTLPNGESRFFAQARLGLCSSALSEALAVTLNTIPEDRAFAGADFTACDVDVVTLRAEEPTLGSGRWSLVSGPDPALVNFATPNRAASVVNGLRGPAVYTFRWTLSNGACPDYSSDEVIVTVNRQDTAFAGEDLLVCLAPQIRLSARPAVNGSGVWTQGGVQSQLGVRILEPSNPNTPIAGMQPGNLYAFTWMIQGGCGVASDEVLVLISDPDPYAGMDRFVCTTSASVQLNADEPTEGSRGRWYALDPQTLISNPAQRQAVVSNLRPGDNLFVWEIDEGICGADSRDTVRIQYRASPVAANDQLSVPFGERTLLPVLGNDSYTGAVRITILEAPTKGTLQIQSDSILIYQPGINVVGTDRFRYELCSDGCECSTAEVVVEIGRDVGCFIPSVITPNNDNINDAFVIPCLLEANAYPNSQLLVFNRLGAEVFRSGRPYRNNWMGTYNGEPLPVGTYFYILDLGDGSAPARGFFVIQR